MAQEVTLAQPSPGARLWRNRHFNTLWFGQAISVLGDAFAAIALPLLIFELTNSVFQMGLVTSVSGISMLISGLFAGVLVDRMDRRRLMIWCDIGRTLVYGSIPLMAFVVGPQLWLIFAVAIGASALSMLFQVAYSTSIPNLVDHDQLTDANSRLQITYGVGMAIGPILGGLFSNRFGPSAAIGVNALSFLVSAVCLVLIRFRPPGADQPVKKSALNYDEVVAGLRFVLTEPVLRSVTIMFFLFTLVASGGYDLFIYHLKHNLGQDDSAVGLVFGVAALGGVLGGVLAPLLRRRLGFGICFIGGMCIECAAIALIGLSPTVPLIAGLAAGMVFANTVKLINSMSLRQEITPNHLLGRVTSAFWIIIRTPAPIGAAVTTWVGAQVGAAPVLVGMGVLGLAIALYGLLTPARLTQ
ncbi:MAG: MFS transporter [Chloroflexaceae bacterium]|jgi:MFS family permease|nr:MFS transporter [Chloroflexaceae bacterium]